MSKVKEKNKQTIYDILNSRVPRNFNESKAKHQGRGINVFRNATNTQPTLLPQEPTKNLSDYSTSKKNHNDVAGKLQGKPSIIKRIGQILFSIIKLPVVLFTKILDLLKSCFSNKSEQSPDIQDSLNIECKKEEDLTNDITKLNSKEHILSEFEEIYLLGDEKYYPCEAYDTREEEYYPCEVYDTREEEYYPCEVYDTRKEECCSGEEVKDEYTEPKVAVIVQDETIDTKKAKMCEQVNLYQTTNLYKKSRDKCIQIGYKFIKEKLFPTFYDMYKFDIELYNKGKSWMKRSIIYNKFLLIQGIELKYKGDISKKLEQLYNAMFINTIDKELQQSIQQEIPAIETYIIEKTEIKIHTLFTKLIDGQVTLRDYEQSSNQYLALFDEDYDKDCITKLFHELIITVSNNVGYDTDDEVAQQIKYIVIAFLINTVNYSKQELDEYLSASKN